jgi:hypothetical protein
MKPPVEGTPAALSAKEGMSFSGDEFSLFP